MAVARQPGDHRRPARPRRLRQARRTCALYSMSSFADQVGRAARPSRARRAPVVGGTSLGANVALELAVRHPRARRAGCSSRCRCSTTRCSAPALIFTPILLGLRFGKPLLRGVAAAHQPDPAHQLPRRHRARLDSRRDPEASRGRARGHPVRPHGAAARGARADRAAGAGDRPPRRPAAPVLGLRHAGRGDAATPGWSTPTRSSSGGSRPARLDDELADFLDEVYAAEPGSERRGSAA